MYCRPVQKLNQETNLILIQHTLILKLAAYYQSKLRMGYLIPVEESTDKFYIIQKNGKMMGKGFCQKAAEKN